MSRIPTFTSSVPIPTADFSGQAAIGGALQGAGNLMGELAVRQQKANNQRESNKIAREFHEQLYKLRDASLEITDPDEREAFYNTRVSKLHEDAIDRSDNDRVRESVEHRIGFDRVAIDTDIRRGLHRDRMAIGVAGNMADIDQTIETAAPLVLDGHDPHIAIADLEERINESEFLSPARKKELIAGLDERLNTEVARLRAKEARESAEVRRVSLKAANDELQESSDDLTNMVVNAATPEELAVVVSASVRSLENAPGARLPGAFGFDREPTQADLRRMLLTKPLELAAQLVEDGETGAQETFDALAEQIDSSDPLGQAFVDKLRDATRSGANRAQTLASRARDGLQAVATGNFDSDDIPSSYQGRNKMYELARDEGGIHDLPQLADMFAQLPGALPPDLMKDFGRTVSDAEFDLPTAMETLETIYAHNPDQADNLASTARPEDRGFVAGVFRLYHDGLMTSEDLAALSSPKAVKLYAKLYDATVMPRTLGERDESVRAAFAGQGDVDVTSQQRELAEYSGVIGMTAQMAHSGKIGATDQDIFSDTIVTEVNSEGVSALRQEYAPIPVYGRAKMPLVRRRMLYDDGGQNVSRQFFIELDTLARNYDDLETMPDLAVLDSERGVWIIPLVDPVTRVPKVFAEWSPNGEAQ